MMDAVMIPGKRDRSDLGLPTREDLDHEAGAQRLRVAEEFGEEYLTNAAGEQLPDAGDAGDPAAAAEPVGLSEEYPSEAREALDDAGLEERQLGEETADELAAAEAADAAHRVVMADGGGDAAADDEQAAIIDALAAAEDAYDAAHPQAAPDMAHRHLRGEAGAAKAPDAAAAAPGDMTGGSVPSGAAGASAKEEISSPGREGARKRLAAALAGNTAFVATGGDAAAVAANVEAGVHGAAGTRAGYRAVLANAVRLAATVTDSDELLRIALSGPQASPEQMREQEKTLPVESSGLQGTVMKPRYS